MKGGGDAIDLERIRGRHALTPSGDIRPVCCRNPDSAGIVSRRDVEIDAESEDWFVQVLFELRKHAPDIRQDRFSFVGGGWGALIGRG